MKTVKTTHIQGILLDNMGNTMNEATITAEKTDRDLSYTGLRVSTKTSIEGVYNFKLLEGFYRIFVTPSDKKTETEIGTVHVNAGDYDKAYTLEELLDK